MSGLQGPPLYQFLAFCVKKNPQTWQLWVHVWFCRSALCFAAVRLPVELKAASARPCLEHSFYRRTNPAASFFTENRF